MSVQDFATTVSEEKKAAKKEERKLTAYDVSLQEDALESQHRLVDGIATQWQMAQWKDRYGYERPSEARLEEAYDKSQSAAFSTATESLLESHKYKRKKRYKKKAVMQVNACELFNSVYHYRTDAREMFCQKKAGLEFSKEDVAFVQDWSAFYYEGEDSKNSGFNDLAKIFSDDEQVQRNEAQRMAAKLMDMDLSVFEYKDDNEFLARFKEHYKTVCAFSNFEKIIKLLDDGEDDEKITRLKARVRVMNDIRDDYENRLQIMQSPYYALMLEQDTEKAAFGALKDEQLYSSGRAYFTAVENKLHLRFGSGSSAKDLEKLYITGEYAIEEEKLPETMEEAERMRDEELVARGKERRRKRDAALARQKKQKEDDTEEVAPTVEDNMMRREHFAMRDAMDQLTQKGVKEDDAAYEKSDEMIRVRTAISKWSTLMSKPVEKGDAFEAAKMPLLDAYKEIIQSCESYRKAIESKSDATALERLDKIIAQCNLEMSSLQMLTQNELLIPEDPKYKQVWSDVVYCIRAVKIRLDDPEISVVGQGSSIIYRLKHEGGHTSYVKRSESALAHDYDSGINEVADKYAASGDAHCAEIAEAIKKLCEDKATFEQLFAIMDFADDVRLETIEWDDDLTEEEYKKHAKQARIDRVKDTIVSSLDKFSKAFRSFAEKHMEDLLDFVSFANKKGVEIGHGYHVGRIAWGSEISSRNASTSRLAQTLGVEEIVASSKTALIVGKDGRMARANEMEGVETRNMQELYDYCMHYGIRLKLSPTVIRQFGTMQVFDEICGQVDRNGGNYNVFFDESVPGEITITSVKAIDNDLSFGELLFSQFDFVNRKTAFARLVEGDLSTLPFLDKTFYDRLVSLEKNNWEELDKIGMDQADIRTPSEIAALKDRIKGVVGQLKDLVGQNVIRLLKPEDWESEDIPSALTELYQYRLLGEGYLSKLCAVAADTSSF